MEKYVSVDQGFEGERDSYFMYWQTLLLLETMFLGLNKQDNINNPVHKLL